MQPKRSKPSLLSVSALVVLAGCATGRVVPTIETCISHPASLSLACVDRDGQSKLVPYDMSGGYVCMPKDQFTEWFLEISK